MSDNLENTEDQNRARINIREGREVLYWTKRFKVSQEQLVEAVEQVGTSASAVSIYLDKAL